jgi:hypothetical protein
VRRAPAFIVIGSLVVACTTANTVPGGGSSGTSGAPREALPCATGEITNGVQAYDRTAEGGGAACDVGTVLDADDQPATVGRPAEGTHTIAGKTVTGCIAVEFGEAIALSAIVMKMRPVSGGCGHTCGGAGRDGCGAGGSVVLFTGRSLEALEFLQTMALTEKTFFEYSVSVHRDRKARFAVVCRDAAAPGADALAIDWIGGRCY